MAVRPQSPSSSSSSSSSTSWSSRTTTLMSRTTTTTSTSTTMVVGRWWCLWWTMLLWHPLVVGNNNGAYACTVFLVGRDATVDGSVLVSHSGDGEFDTDPRLVQVPAQDHDAPGSRRPVYFSPESYPRYVGTDRGIAEYFPTSSNNDDHDQNKPFVPIGFIPQVSHTYAYLEETYGAVNEHSLAMGESTCSGVFGAIPLGAPNGTALFSIDELTRVAMERCTTARQAIQLMGDLAVQYGFYGAGEFEGTAESLAVTDGTTGGEAWIFHILPDPTGRSAIWAAQRMPDDSVAVLANMFVIRHVDPQDTENFLMSESVHQVALEYHWWNPDTDGLLDFTKIYSDGEYAHKYYSGRRMWGAYRLIGYNQTGDNDDDDDDDKDHRFAPEFPDDYVDLQSDPVYPVYAKPKYLLSVADLFRFHRDTYQSTKYELGATGNLAGGPFGTPDRWKEGPNEEAQVVPGHWERPIGLYRTSDTFVVQTKPKKQQTQQQQEQSATRQSGGGSQSSRLSRSDMIANGDSTTSKNKNRVGTSTTTTALDKSKVQRDVDDDDDDDSRSSSSSLSLSSSPLDAILWFAPASPLGSVFTPFVPSMPDIPASFRSGHQAKFDRSTIRSAFWAACLVHNVANLKWSYAIQDVQHVQAQLEQASMDLIHALEQQQGRQRSNENKNKNEEEEMTIYQALIHNAEQIVERLWLLSDELLFKYASGFVNELPDQMSQPVGYPAWWLQAMESYTHGPPPPPTQPKCCHPTNNHTNHLHMSTTTGASAAGTNYSTGMERQPHLTGKAAMRAYLKLLAEQGKDGK